MLGFMPGMWARKVILKSCNFIIVTMAMYDEIISFRSNYFTTHSNTLSYPRIAVASLGAKSRAGLIA